MSTLKCSRSTDRSSSRRFHLFFPLRSIKSIGVLAVAAAAFAIAISAHGLDSVPKSVLANPQQQADRSMGEARQTFENRCAGCHGLDGRGGERAPDIATSAKVQQRTDTSLTQIITNGIPTGGMPSFSSLDAPTIRSLVKYLRFLQGASQTAALPGSSEAGKALFFGGSRCSQCHLVGGGGGFIGPDLSSYGRRRSPEEIRDAITTPSKMPGIGRSVVTVTTRRGQSIKGVVRNEDNFSIQLQSLDGVFHLVSKSDIENLSWDENSLMPADYGSTLNSAQLNDLVSFLMSIARHDKAGDAKLNSEPMDEEE
jgi:cytochrome c oxidase cbb3-type subunit 3